MRIRRALSGAALALAYAALSAAQTPGPTPYPTPRPTPWLLHGPEIQVNATTSGDQKEPAAAIGAGGGSVVVWTSAGQDGDGDGVFARRFDAAGLPLSTEFRVNTSTAGDQAQPAIAADYAGNFVIAWTGPDGAGGTDVFAQRYDADGSPQFGEFVVNIYTTGAQGSPRVAMSSDGFVIVWSSAGQDGDQGGIYGQRFSVNGVPNGGEFRINSTTTGDQKSPSITQSPYGGGFIVVWESRGQDGDQGGIFGRKYDSSGAAIGNEFAVNASTTGDQTEPDVVGTDGEFTVVWSSVGPDDASTGVFGHLFSSDAPVTTDFRAAPQLSGTPSRPRVGRGPDNYPRGFIVVWQSAGHDDPADPSGLGIFAQRFDNSPYPSAASFLVRPREHGAVYQVNGYATGDQSRPAMAFGQDGRFVVAWESDGQDGSGHGVFAERFRFPNPVRLEVDETASGGASNVNGVIESGERVVVAPFWGRPKGPFSQLALFANADNLTGADGPTRVFDDALADYGSIGPGMTVDCLTASGNCYEVTISGARPSQHWDDTFDEHPASDGPFGAAQPMTKTWSLHVGGSFADVVPDDLFYPYVENLLHNGVTAGGGCGTGVYCGDDVVLRQQMAVFLLKSSHGRAYVPPPATGGVFADVPVDNPFAPWIEQLAAEQITGGCTAPPPPALPSYCPTDPVNRQQMAVFLYKARWADTYGIPGCTGVFDDVPCPSPFAGYIDSLYGSGVTGGCQTSPLLYCPTDPTKRKQMAAFLVKNFGLLLYGPD
jgi:hypothetical protein